ncbi:hypothetical protein [Amycolatopsis sp. NBC_01480]|uniref:hypothetical protein n=1 Tax=Amycolatopsis sp. NBC_01480 TaxID=2903562 RepID=UPI002E2806A5|nr:hypothetical protein [Amycolatopsis sp. NBC_01480]
MTVGEHLAQQLRSHLVTQLADVAAMFPSKPDWCHNSAQALVLGHGRWFRPAPLPVGRTLGSPGRCFANATRHAARHDLAYVEGFALPEAGPVLQHAWCARRDGTVEDPTWGADGLAYLGIPFTRHYLQAQHRRGNTHQLLFEQHRSDWELFRFGIGEDIVEDIGELNEPITLSKQQEN